jgi:acetyl-CoA carboxylase biotin carboxyl carrier protein
MMRVETRTCNVQVVMAEMVGSIWKVAARAGDEVGPGDALVILESMSMEIPVVAEVAGVVREMMVIERMWSTRATGSPWSTCLDPVCRAPGMR